MLPPFLPRRRSKGPATPQQDLSRPNTASRATTPGSRPETPRTEPDLDFEDTLELITPEKSLASSLPDQQAHQPALVSFFVETLAELRPALLRQLPQASWSELQGVIFKSHSYSRESIEDLAAQLPCETYFVHTCGLIGWDPKLGAHREVEQRGRGAEFGHPGTPLGGAGIMVVALRKPEPSQPRVVLSAGAAPTLADGAVGHILYCSISRQEHMTAFITCPEQAVCAGGLNLNIWQRVAKGKWKVVDFLVITFMDADRCAFNVSITDIFTNTPGARYKGKELLTSLPAGYRPELVGLFPCILRGQGLYGELNVEVKGLADLLGQDVRVFGFPCLCEVGNNRFGRNPDGWNSRQPGSTSTHQGSSIICCYALKDPKLEGKQWGAAVGTPLAARLELMRQLAVLRQRNGVEPEPQKALQDKSTMGSAWAWWAEWSAKCLFGCDMPKAVEPTSRKGLSVPLSAFQSILRGVPLEKCGAMSVECYKFWVPEALQNAELFEMSAPVEQVDIFISQVIKPEKGRDPMLYAFIKAVDTFYGAVQIAVKLCSRHAEKYPDEPPLDPRAVVGGLSFWVDRACVNQDNEVEKMMIIKSHLEDFLLQARFVVCILTSHYFTRLWCIFEFCCALAYRLDLGSIVMGSFGGGMSLPLAQQIADSIANINIASAQCFDLADRGIIEGKIKSNFRSIAHFESFAKFAALAMLARDALANILEMQALEIWELYISTARRCGFPDLEAALLAFDVEEALAKLQNWAPDFEAATQAHRRVILARSELVEPWFQKRVAPLIDVARQLAVRSVERDCI